MFLNVNVSISINISRNFILNVQINNILVLVQIRAWHRPGDKPLSEPLMDSLLAHLCVTQPQWVKDWMMEYIHRKKTLQWRHNDHDAVLNQQPHGCLLNRLFRRIKENIKAPRHWPLCEEFTGTGEFSALRASYAQNVSIWWLSRHSIIC